MNKFLILAVIALVGSACGPREKRYPMQGKVLAVDPAARTATVAAGKIGDWMDPMTMEFPVRPDAELAKMHTGDQIRAIVVVEGEKYYLTAVEVAPAR